MKSKSQTNTNIILERFNPSIENGLNDEQVALRISQRAINNTTKKYSNSIFTIIRKNVCTLFNLYGLICLIALIVAKARLSNMFFALIYLCNIFIGIFQEIRAKKIIDKLCLTTEKKIKVIRNSEILEIDSKEIVLDDILFLGLGTQIPVDCILLDGEIEVNESLLTGESVPIKKKKGDKLFAGSFIVSGTCKVRADIIGKDTFIEKLATKAKEFKSPHSDLMLSLKKIIKYIGFGILPIAILFVIIQLLANNNSNLIILNTTTVVIGMIPSGMMLLTSVALAVGVIKLAKQRTLTQDLYSLEMLARVDTICFDKTGTLTDGKMTIKETIKISNEDFDENKIISSMIFALNDDNQTALALKDKFGNKKFYDAKIILPFNSKRKLSAVTFANNVTFAFGAPEFVLDEKEFNKLSTKINNIAKQGYRVLVLAKSNNKIEKENAPNDFTPLSLIVIADNIRKEAFDTVKWFKENGVTIKVISGDNPLTVAEVSKRVGIENAEKCISLEGLTDEEVIKIANEYTVFGRVTPEQKALLVRSMKNNKHTVAMTGDGVNDILAMKECDCAITVASGSGATRSVAQIVLLDNNFNSIHKVVLEGRRVINNIQSSASLYLMKTIYTMIIALYATIFKACRLPIWPLNKMILLEVLIIGIPSFFLSFQPNYDKVKGKFIAFVIKKSLPAAIIMAINVIVFDIILKSITLDANIKTTMITLGLLVAGIVCLAYTCMPFNRFRVLVFVIFSLLTIIFVILSILGITTHLGLIKLSPISDYVNYFYILIAMLVVDIPLYFIVEKICALISRKIQTK